MLCSIQPTQHHRQFSNVNQILYSYNKLRKNFAFAIVEVGFQKVQAQTDRETLWLCRVDVSLAKHVLWVRMIAKSLPYPILGFQTKCPLLSIACLYNFTYVSLYQIKIKFFTVLARVMRFRLHCCTSPTQIKVSKYNPCSKILITYSLQLQIILFHPYFHNTTL